MTTLRLLLGDQLSRDISTLKTIDKAHDWVMLCEVKQEATYVKHHKRKIAFLFSAMRHFAQALKTDGYQVHYTKLDDPDNRGDFRSEVQRVIEAKNIDHLIVTFPGEYRVWQDMKTWQQELGVSVEIRPDNRFLCQPREFSDWAQGHKSVRMEFFYRHMRKQHRILMEDSKPIGGKWNYDHDNRQPPKKGLSIPKPLTFEPDNTTKTVLQLVEDQFSDHFGSLANFGFAVTRDQALAVLHHFITERLPEFGIYQDAMLQDEPWMYHSHISFYLNCGLLDARECIEAAEQTYHHGDAPLNAVEGFIRQILGWREFIRGMYWHHMPAYATKNALNAQRPLPDFFWTGKTDMQCLAQAIDQTHRYAYAHHIQRLMIIGNFALLAGLSPEAVQNWFLLVYADAYEWVELPNVQGMILYADDGAFASKPYAASGAYISKMSNYCQGCRYNVKDKNGEDACPFNYLYWDFIMRHEARWRNNPRMAMMVRQLDKMSQEKRAIIQQDTLHFLGALT